MEKMHRAGWKHLEKPWMKYSHHHRHLIKQGSRCIIINIIHCIAHIFISIGLVSPGRCLFFFSLSNTFALAQWNCVHGIGVHRFPYMVTNLDRRSRFMGVNSLNIIAIVVHNRYTCTHSHLHSDRAAARRLGVRGRFNWKKADVSTRACLLAWPAKRKTKWKKATRSSYIVYTHRMLIHHHYHQSAHLYCCSILVLLLYTAVTLNLRWGSI